MQFRSECDFAMGSWNTDPIRVKWVKENNFPCQEKLTNKARLWQNYKKARVTFGSEYFDFELYTFVLPEEREQLREQWNSSKIWISKPFHVSFLRYFMYVLRYLH